MNRFAPVSWRFVALALAWLAFAGIASRDLSAQMPGAVAVRVFILAAPVALAGAYSSTVDQLLLLSHFRPGGWAHWVLSLRFCKTVLWLVWALCSSFIMLIEFSLYARLEWLALVIAIPVFWLIYALSHRFLFSELKKPYVVSHFAIVWVRLVGPVLMLAIYLALVWNFGPAEHYGSLTDALAARRLGLSEGRGSALVALALRLFTFADGSRAYLASRFQDDSPLIPLALMAGAAYVVFFNASASFSCLAIRPVEFRRVFGPLTDADVPPPLRGRRVALVSAVVTVVTLFIALPLFGRLEETARRHPEALQAIGALERQVERIDQDFYNPGTIEKIQTAKAVMLGKIQVSRATLEGQVDLAFATMEAHVDGYLDWYYGLPAEYMRLAKLLTGDIEGYLEEQLAAHLKKGDPSGQIERGIDALRAAHGSALDEYRSTVAAILDGNRLPDDGRKQTVTRLSSAQDLFSMPMHADLVAFDERVAGGAAVAGIGGLVVGKIVGKTLFKTAAKALTKVAVSEAGGAATGAVAGAAAGSIVPGIGTVVGGVVGGVIGGIAVDAALLKLEETFSRAQFKQEIVAAIRQTKADLKARLFVRL